MHKFKLKLGKEKIEYRIKEENFLGLLESDKAYSKTEENIIKDSLENPIKSDKLRNIVNKGERVCIVVSDVTRMYQKPDIFLPYIVEELKAGGIEDSDIFFLCALGSHRKQTLKEHKKILGDKLYEKYDVIDHDCDDKSNLVNIGTTSRGTPVEINKLAVDADRVVVTGAVVYHVMAGWGGGRKSILPGISSRKSIMINHAHSITDTPGKGPNPECGSAIYEGNPLNEDMVEAAEMFNPDFMFNVILGQDRIVDAVSGNITAAHKVGCEKVSKENDFLIDELADMVVVSAGGFPKDINYYQSTKAMLNSMRSVKSDGVIIILADCSEGIGNPEVSYIINNFKNNLDRENELRENYTISKYIGFESAWHSEVYNIIYVSSIDTSLIENIPITVVGSLDEALQKAKEIKGSLDMKTYVMPDASVFPVLK
ncbi:MAG: nickel-dependent lactate racemase [Bacillota bacterium]|nr:nickel-dependent lactate racemase [Bacillota bacterium]